MATALIIMNKEVAVMASDRDFSIFKCSENSEAAFGVMTDPTSFLPWDDIIRSFRLNHPIRECGSFYDYCSLLKQHLKTCKDELQPCDEYFYVAGYDSNEIFPICTRYQLIFDGTDVKILEDFEASIDNKQTTYLDHLGHLDKVHTFLLGVNDDMGRDIEEIFISLAHGKEEKDTFRQVYEKSVKKAQRENKQKLIMAIDAFDKEDIVYMAEDLINAQGQQDHLADPTQPLNHTREIALIARAEGFVWIKHSVFGA